jgi:AraC-like DNA-binding protein
MDPLSDVLRAVRLTGAYFYLVEAAAPWSVSTAPARELAPRILPDAEHLIAYHILTEGGCWGGVQGEHQVEMRPGDVIVFPQGDAHVMSSHRGPRLDGEHRASPLRYPSTVLLGDGKRETKFVCGFLGCDARPFNPLLSALPRVLYAPRLGDGWLATFPDQAVRESRAGRAGSDTMLTRMAELMFITVLRQYIETSGPELTGWLAGLRDPVVGAALSLMHERPVDDWSLAKLAREVAASRSVLSERFTRVVGVPPMQYLAQWRLQLAAELLASGGTKVSAVGMRVGYESEAAFSRAFKRATGASPAEWRRRRQLI